MKNSPIHRVQSLFLTLTFVLGGSLALNGCAKKAQVQEDSSVPSSADADTNNGSGDSDSGKAYGLQTIHFGYDSSVLDGESKQALAANADILKDKTSVKVQIEGHCDAHGGIQYNLALGEKRANAVRKYLADLGVAKARITTISFGKERLLDTGTSPEADAKNRRANFVITSR